MRGNPDKCKFMVLASSLNRRNEGDDRIHTLSAGGEIHDAFSKYLAGSLALYRGIESCHFCLNALKDGLLKSEGERDVPTYTMGETDPDNKTRWLPTDLDDGIPNLASIGNPDPFIRDLSKRDPVFIGLVLKIPIKAHHFVCWINEGEISVRGPLEEQDYEIHTMTWLVSEQPFHLPWPHDINKRTLPEPRPYHPQDQNDIDDWWSRSQGWADTIAPQFKKGCP
jgi:hypothetical protein